MSLYDVAQEAYRPMWEWMQENRGVAHGTAGFVGGVLAGVLCSSVGEPWLALPAAAAAGVAASYGLREHLDGRF